MMSRSQGFFWLALQLSVAAGGAAGALESLTAGVLTCLLALPLNLFTLKKGWDTRANPELSKPLADGLAAVGLILFLALLFSSGLMTALGLLLVFVTLALNVQLNNYRKFYLVQMVSFVLMLVGAAEATSGSFLLVMTLYCILAAFSLSEAWLDQSALNAPAENASIALAQGGPGFGQRALTGLLVMGVAVVIYLLTPRLEALNWGGQESSSGEFYHNTSWQKSAEKSLDQPYQKPPPPQNSSSEQYEQLQNISELSDFKDDGYHYGGFNESFDIRDSDRSGAAGLNGIVAHMKAAHGTYLKVRTFDTFDGVSWSSSNEDISRKLEADGSGLVQINPHRTGNFLQTITIEVAMPAWLPVAPDPVALWVPSSTVALDQFAQPLLPATIQKKTRYTVNSVNEVLDNRPLSRTPAADKNDLQLPRGFDARIRRLAQQVTAKETSVYGKAVALEQHLRTQYEYSFASVFESQGHTPLSQFLFGSKKGHCEYFASAMTIMLRSLKIPARLVTGFSVHSQNPLTGYFEIHALDGHAWSEAWIDGRWVTFEPTAYYDLPPQQQSHSAAEQISQYAQDLLKRQDTADAGDFSLTALLSSLWLALSTLLVMVLATLKMLLLALLPWLGVGALLGLVGWFTRHLWWRRVLALFSRWKIQRYQPQGSRQALQFYLFHLQRMSAVRVAERQPQELLEEWLIRVADVWPVAEQAAQLQRLAAQILYEEQPVAHAELGLLVQEFSRRLR